MQALAGIANPFHSTVVADPWKGNDPDVSAIHAGVFQRCLQAIDYVRDNHVSAGIIIHGEPGSGKTHLLARLRRSLAKRQSEVIFSPPNEVFVYIRLGCNPRMMWRHFRERLADDLFRPMPGGRTQIESVVVARLAEEDGGAGGDLEEWWNFVRNKEPQRALNLLESLGEKTQLSNDFMTVLEHVAFARHRRQTRSWLRGDSMPESTLDELRLGRVSPDDADPETDARQTLLALCRLAGPNIPIVFCFDQIEALQSTPLDNDGLFKFGQSLREINDNCGNAVLITCAQTSFLGTMRSAIRDPDHHAIERHGFLSLGLLDENLAEELIVARMDADPPLAARRREQNDRVWPLSKQDVERTLTSNGRVGRSGCTPRQLIAACSSRFDDLKGLGPSGPSLETVLENEWQTRQHRSAVRGGAETSQQVLADGLPRAIEVRGDNWKCVPEDSIKDVDFVIAAPEREGRIGVSICTQQNMTSLAARLRRLCDEVPKSDIQKLVLLRDPRTPISKTSKRVRERLHALQKDGAVLLQPSVEALAALDALRDLLADAQSGDLAANGQTVEARTLTEWLKNHIGGQLELEQLLDDICSQPRIAEIPTQVDEEALDALMEHLNRVHVVELGEASRIVGRPRDALEALVRKHRDRFGYLTGPPAVVFEPVERPASLGG